MRVWGPKVLHNSLSRDRRGASLIEYVLLISLLTLIVLSFIIVIGDWANDMWRPILR
jgi:Flp pilus assembly pilin Flp